MEHQHSGLSNFNEGVISLGHIGKEDADRIFRAVEMFVENNWADLTRAQVEMWRDALCRMCAVIYDLVECPGYKD